MRTFDRHNHIQHTRPIVCFWIGLEDGTNPRLTKKKKNKGNFSYKDDTKRGASKTWIFSTPPSPYILQTIRLSHYKLLHENARHRVTRSRRRGQTQIPPDVDQLRGLLERVGIQTLAKVRHRSYQCSLWLDADLLAQAHKIKANKTAAYTIDTLLQIRATQQFYDSGVISPYTGRSRRHDSTDAPLSLHLRGHPREPEVEAYGE